MALNFPNLSRSYDAHHRNVRFWGYDGAFEISFIVEQSALARFSQGLTEGEVATLNAFDRYREKILAAARRVYRGRATNTYSLTSSDF